MSEGRAERPRQVTQGVWLSVCVMLLGMAQAVILALRHIEVRSPDLLIVSKVVIYCISAFLIFRVARGANWARWLLAIIMLFAIPLTIWPSLQALNEYPFYGALEVMQVVLFLSALLLLFRGPGGAWFSNR